MKTLYISPVNDKSGFGNPQYRELLMQMLTEKFRSDNSLQLVDQNGDSKLHVSIVSIREEISAVSPGELADEKRVTVTCSAEFYDAVNNKTLVSKSFSNFDVYQISRAQAGRDEAIRSAIDLISDDILIAVVSGW
ncbi:MAG: LPS assembly lipoprotein LptE [Candidatus Kapaibacterium sp.]